jgi:hypothetical protein
MEVLPPAALDPRVDRGSGNTRAQQLLAAYHSRLLGDKSAQAWWNQGLHTAEYADRR